MPVSFFNSKIVQMRPGEATTAWLMFAYSFLAMTSYNIVKPLTKGKFIDGLGADNMPYVLLAASVLIGLLMQMYSRASGRLPGRAVVPVTLVGLAGSLVTFWLLFQTGAVWVAVAFYVFGLSFGILVISQFWTIANDVYNSRQARRLFGFIGGGASLGGALGNGITGFLQTEVGENNLLLVSAAALGLCAAIVSAISRRESLSANLAAAASERGVGGGEALRLLRESRHLQLIALVIGLAVLCATIVDQQLNIAAETELSGRSVSEFLAEVGLYLSLASFIVQVALTKVIHRSLGLGVALLVLPFGLGVTALAILATGALWAPAAGSVLDRSLRYSLDKTTREVLFLPLPSDLKQRAKPFVDVTVDRLGKAIGALFVLVLIKPWGLGLDWPQLSYASLALVSLWIVVALLARREYLRSFRKSLDTRNIEPGTVQVAVADPATIEALVEELAHPDEASVIYAIDMLEMLDRRHLITPLLLHHESPKVRARALRGLSSVRADLAERWIPAVHRMLKDPDADVRAAAVRALEALAKEEAPTLMHRFLEDADPRVAATAATVLADSPSPDHPPLALATLSTLIADDRALAAGARREAAAALAHISNPAFRSLLLPLLHDPDIDVAREAIASARRVGRGDVRFLPALVSLLGHRVLKAPARAALVSFGADVIPPLAYFLQDEGEQVWVRRHVPATLAAIPCQASMDALFAAVDNADGFLRYKIIEAIETLRRTNLSLTLPPGVVESLVLKETARYYNYLTLRFNILQRGGAVADTLVVRALDDKLERTLDRVYRLLGLIYTWKDIAAARQGLETGDARTRSHAIEYLDNLLSGPVRRNVMPMLDDLAPAERVRAANSLLRTRPRDLEDTIAQLIHEPDPVVAAAAIRFVATHGMWSLAHDVEYAAAHRTSDHLVADAAAWALSVRRQAGGAPGESPGAPLPIVDLADRLRAIPMFDFVSVDELFRIATAGRQVRYEAGHTLYDQGVMADDVHFLTDGTVRFVDGDSPEDVHAPAALAFEDLLEGRPVGRTMTAVESAVSLCLSSASLLTMMSDNIVLARGFFRMLVGAGGDRQPRDAVHAASQPATAWRLPLEPIDKAGLLRQTSILGHATVDQLLALVAVTREVTLTAGATLFTETDLPAVYYVLEGEVLLERTGAEPAVVTAGGMIGMTETLAGLPLNCRARVVRSGHALRFDQDSLFDVLADHVDLLQGLFSGVLKASTPHASPDRSP